MENAKNLRILIVCGSLFTLAVALGNPNYQWSAHRNTPYGADFLQEWTAADLILNQRAAELYDHEGFAAAQHNATKLGFNWPNSQYYPAVYPPAYYCLFAPLACMPYRVATLVWLFILVGAYFAAAYLIELALKVGSSTALPEPNSIEQTDTAVRAQGHRTKITMRDYTWIWVVSLLLPAAFVGYVMGQKGSLWLLVLAVAFYSAKRDQSFMAGAALGFLVLKPTLAFLLPGIMLVQRQYRMLCGFVTTCLALLAVSFCLVPLSSWLDYLQVICQSQGYQAHAGYRIGWSTSLITLADCLVLVTGTWPSRLLIIGVAGLLVTRVARLCWPGTDQLGFASSAGSEETSRRGSGSSASTSFLVDGPALFSILAATALASPHAYFYDLVWLLLPLRLIADRSWRLAAGCTAALWLGQQLCQHFEFGPPWLCIVLLWLVLLVVPLARGSQGRAVSGLRTGRAITAPRVSLQKQ